MPHQLWLLITDIAHIQMSQWQMSMHTNTQYCILQGWRGWADDSAHTNTHTSSETDKKHNTKMILWYKHLLFIMHMTANAALKCVMCTEFSPSKLFIETLISAAGKMADKK